MKKTLLAFGIMLLTGISVMAQVPITAKPLKKVISLAMPGETGNNGASVVWHPLFKKYYASYAGNTSYPMAVFDVTGKQLSPDELETMFDVRGMWYNTVSKQIEANGYDASGWVSYSLDSKGIPEEIENLHDGQVQPDPQSVGAFDAAKKRISFLKNGSIFSYSLAGEEAADVVDLKRKGVSPATEGELEEEGESEEKYNSTSLCYTGIPNAEFAIMNYGEMQIELYNRKGILTKAFKIPDDTLLYTNFNFAYANGIWWLFDKGEKKWFGFK
ncbi:MAG: hypothetical protein SGI83_11030 [Bacteroidota bacterium]|nr:hypothetical protein [Bacteroidota bacterium]